MMEKSFHDSVRILLANLGDQQSAHAGASAAAEGVAHLEPLEAVATLGLLADHVQNAVDQLRPLRVVALSPVVARACLAKDEVVRAEKLPERPSTDAVHGAGLQVHQHRAGDVAPSGRLVVVHVDALQLEVGIPVISPSRVDAVLVADDLPELGADLVPALAALDVDELAHGCGMARVAHAGELHGAV